MCDHDNICDLATKDVNTTKLTIGHACLCTHCIICREPIELSELESKAIIYSGGRVESKVCDKCRKAIMYLRNQVK